MIPYVFLLRILKLRVSDGFYRHDIPTFRDIGQFAYNQNGKQRNHYDSVMVKFPVQFREGKMEKKNQAKRKISGVCFDTTGRSPVAEASNWTEPSKSGRRKKYRKIPFRLGHTK